MEIIKSKPFSRSLAALLLAILVAVPASANTLVIGQQKFESKVPSPSLLAICNQTLWVYSVEKNSIYHLDPTTGESNGSISLQSAHGIRLTSLSCSPSGNGFMAGAQKRVVPETREYFIAQISLSGNVELRKPPGTGIVRDVHCDSGICLLIQDEVFEAKSDLQWKKVKVAPAGAVPPKKLPTEDNPFIDRASEFDQSTGRYFRASVVDSQRYFLLDPARAQIVDVDHKTGKASRWGRWGFWEGSLMLPKSLAVVSKKVVAVGDAGTKVVFFYTFDGDYIGGLGLEKDFDVFAFPSAMIFRNGLLYVADFLGNHVRAFTLPLESSGELKTTQLPDTLTRINLFRSKTGLENQARTRCLTCHDGQRRYSLERFISNRAHHPFDVEVKEKTDLPLSAENKMSCGTCHDTHHKHISGVRVDQKGNSKHYAELPYMLRKEERALCASCHVVPNNSKKSHIDLKAGTGKNLGATQVVSCTQCHQSHSGEKKLLVEKVPELCIGCHTKERIPQNHPLDEKSNCTNCHQLHGSEKDLNFARVVQSKRTGAQVACQHCHETAYNPEGISKKHFEKIKAKQPHHWLQSEVACLECHSPHKKKLPMPESCWQCHTDRKNTHSQPMTIEETDRAKGILLVKNNVTCITCHGKPHGEKPNKDQVLHFCASCHGAKTQNLYENYHKRKERKHVAK